MALFVLLFNPNLEFILLFIFLVWFFLGIWILFFEWFKLLVLILLFSWTESKSIFILSYSVFSVSYFAFSILFFWFKSDISLRYELMLFDFSSNLFSNKILNCSKLWYSFLAFSIFLSRSLIVFFNSVISSEFLFIFSSYFFNKFFPLSFISLLFLRNSSISFCLSSFSMLYWFIFFVRFSIFCFSVFFWLFISFISFCFFSRDIISSFTFLSLVEIWAIYSFNFWVKSSINIPLFFIICSVWILFCSRIDICSL